jgi:hypothetical protein
MQSFNYIKGSTPLVMDPTVHIGVLIGILRSPFYELLGILRSPGAYIPVSSHKVLLIFYSNPTVLMWPFVYQNIPIIIIITTRNST